MALSSIVPSVFFFSVIRCLCLADAITPATQALPENSLDSLGLSFAIDACAYVSRRKISAKNDANLFFPSEAYLPHFFLPQIFS